MSRAPVDLRNSLADLVESLWDVTTGSGDSGKVEAARQRLDAASANVTESDFIVDTLVLLERAARMAVGVDDIGLVVGSDQDIVYDLVLERYLLEQGIREGPYSDQDFRAKAATYPEVHNQLQFELSILDKLESATTLKDFRREAKACSALNPVLWQIAM